MQRKRNYPEAPVRRTAAPDTMVEEKPSAEIAREENPLETKAVQLTEMPAPAPGVGEAEKAPVETGEAKAGTEIARPGASNSVEKMPAPHPTGGKADLRPEHRRKRKAKAGRKRAPNRSNVIRIGRGRPVSDVSEHVLRASQFSEWQKTFEPVELDGRPPEPLMSLVDEGLKDKIPAASFLFFNLL